MILSRSVSVLHFCGVSSAPKLLSQKFKLSFALTYAPCASFRFTSLSRSDGKWVRGFASATEAEVERTDTFFADSAVSWNSLGLSDKISTALQNSGFGRPSLTQAVCIPSIISGKDVIVAAETGSGKTHGYLAPIIDRLTNTALDSEHMSGEERPFQLKNLSLILCPNVTLCEQVVRMVNGLLGEDGNPLLRVEAVCGSQGWPDRLPDIIVSTPGALLNNFEPKRHRRRLEFLRSVKYVVFDEADMLLCGSFQNQIIRLINMLRFDEKQVSRLATSKVGKPLEIDASIAEFDLENEEGAEFEDVSISEEEEEELEYSDDITQIPSVEAATGTGSEVQKNWRRVRKTYSRSKQYIFVAATLPVNGKKTAGGMLKYMFPDAIWVSGNFLHRNSPRLKQKWVEVTVDTQVDALIEAVSNCNNSTERTMVFANTVEAVEAVANVLENASIRCYRYHKNHALEERANILADFREKGGVFVCTDAAARGVDVPNVSHVIQADFASCAVDYVHRIGRTARAGQYGAVTSLYTEANSDLVEAIRQAVQTGQPVETAFSRRRGFRNKLKKSILKAREAEEPQDVRA